MAAGTRVRHFTLIKNAVSNLARGGVAALIALILPPILVRAMPVERYSVWMLVLQMSAYVGFLDFGLQTAVGRFVAHANERGDSDGRDRIVSTSFALLAGAGGLGIILLGLLAWQMPHMFRTMPSSLVPQARLSLLLVGGSLALALPSSAFTGVFIGLQRFEIPAVIISIGKLLGAALVIIVVKSGGNLIHMATVFGAANIIAALMLLWAYRQFASNIRLAPSFISKSAASEVFRYCASLSVWMFGMLLVSGLDTTLVGFFQFQAVAFYSVAVTLVTFIAGLQNMLFTVLMPEAAVMNARGDAESLGRMLISTTRYGVFILQLTGLPLILAARPLLTVWVGPVYAQHTAPLLQILVTANMIRLSAVPYSVLLMGTGQQRFAIISPLVEGISNLLISLIAGFLIGAIGVALGTLVGSVIGVVVGVSLNIPRTTSIRVSRATYVSEGILRPLLSMIPFIVSLILSLFLQLSHSFLFFTFLIATLCTVFITWTWGFTSSDRQALMIWRRPPPVLPTNVLEGKIHAGQ